MIEISIPGRDPLQIEHLVLDYNGTIAADGLLLPGATERIRALSNQVCVHILTAEPTAAFVRNARIWAPGYTPFPGPAPAHARRRS